MCCVLQQVGGDEREGQDHILKLFGAKHTNKAYVGVVDLSPSNFLTLVVLLTTPLNHEHQETLRRTDQPSFRPSEIAELRGGSVWVEGGWAWRWKQ